MSSFKRYTWQDLAIVLTLCLGSITYGYDFSIITFTVAQPQWLEYMQLTADASDTARYSFSNDMIGTAFGLFAAGAIFGAIFVGWYCDAYGRKKALVVAAVINVIGGVLQTSSVHIGMFVFARFITGFAAAIFVTLVPIYIAEVAPPKSRGLLVGQHGAFFLAGYSLASWIGTASYFSSNDSFAWRFPLACQALWPLLMMALISWIPESPRWLISRGRIEEAWTILRHLHSGEDSESQAFAREEFHQINAQFAADKATHGDISVISLFTKPHFRKRMICSAVVMWTSQAGGNLVVYSNIVLLNRGLGLSNALSLVIGAVYITWACVCNFANAAFLDRLGRVRSMLIGFSLGVVALAIEAAITAKFADTDNKAALAAGVGILFFYITTFAGFCDTTLYVYCSEIFPTHIRAKGMSWSIAIFFLSTLPFLESSATAYATIGWKYYMVFISLTVVNIGLMWYLCPETKGLSLEEINGLFGDVVVARLTDAVDVEMATSASIETGDFDVPTPSRGSNTTGYDKKMRVVEM